MTSKLYISISHKLDLYFLLHLQREKKNLQDLNCVYVFNVAERDDLDRPTARLIKDFDCIEGKPHDHERMLNIWF